MKIYTRIGDAGNTSINGKNVPKYDYRIKCVGVLDELNSNIGYIHSILSSDVHTCSSYDILSNIQHILFDIGACVHNPEKFPLVEDKLDGLTTNLEKEIDSITQNLPPLTAFILPSGGKMAGYIHVVRTVCRRAERILVKYFIKEAIPDHNVLKFINRLSDYFFSLARLQATFQVVYKSILFE